MCLWNGGTEGQRKQRIEEKMADRFFPNIMPDFVQENPRVEQEIEQQGHKIPHQGTEESLLRLLSSPYHLLSEKLKRAALDIKETIVVETWGLTAQKVDDFTLYTGVLGTAFLLFKSFQVSNNVNDLSLCSQIIKACDSASVHSRYLILCFCEVNMLCGSLMGCCRDLGFL